ncbi:phosphoribosylglycinamide formyltransferase [Congregibacter brevis]|uniref:Phosphoribosylglycinamide formyltransferase n=1 Tax=Congregibacter brevis TaxID=3081201 RepID=A0ABZ0ICH4_9GAMM|nr:phosphoribosylglycinamide formyltransferase [Congregibacter sp. IMCC45268]
MSSSRRIAILASGAGSNMVAIAQACEQAVIPASIGLIISNVPDAGVLVRAKNLHLHHCCIDHRQFDNREAFERAMLLKLREASIDLVVLAGFMRILTDCFIREYYGSLLNIHPSLLPKYPGLNTHQRALDAGDREAGATVHYVIPELDAGPTIVQGKVPILPGDDADSLAARVQVQEHVIYPQAVRWCLEKKVELRDGEVWKNPLFMDDGEMNNGALRNDRTGA